jgi:hypothetical protein
VGWTTGRGGLCVGGFARRSAPRKEPGNLPRYVPGAGEGRSWPSATTRLDWRIPLVPPTPIEAVAAKGTGVFETLKGVAKLVLADLTRQT